MLISRNASLAQRPTRSQLSCARASKGFGSATPKRGGKPGKPQGPQQAADLALAAEASQAAGRPSKARPIDPREAARGKVDYVQVTDWANGQAADIGELQVVPGSMGTGYSTGSNSAAANTAAAAAAAAADEAAPFFQQLGQHAQYLEGQGALAIANERGAKPYLPFESWQYGLQRYKQYLAEAAAVHAALEAALLLALSSGSPAAAATSSSSSHAWELPGREPHVLSAYAALDLFGRDCGLWRAAAAEADLQALCAGARQSNQQPQQEVRASQNAVAYGKYLLQLGRAAAAATTAAAATAAAADEQQDEGVAAALRLLAHAYALQVQQQCLGTRIGAAATQKLQLLPAGAAALYMDYPSSIEGEPVQQLVRVTDAAGSRLDAAGRQAVLEELPKALKKSALMLAPLATAE